MGFERFGIVSFVTASKVDRFVDLLDEGKVAGTRCKKCGHSFFPPRADCSQCLSGEMGWFEITGTGQLISFSTLIYAPTGFEQDLPYTIALVQYGNDVRVFGRLSKEIEPEDIRVGMNLHLAPVKFPDGHVSYEFRGA
jgi:hypothetical protein